jgi:hypothetical protein
MGALGARRVVTDTNMTNKFAINRVLQKVSDAKRVNMGVYMARGGHGLL